MIVIHILSIILTHPHNLLTTHHSSTTGSPKNKIYIFPITLIKHEHALKFTAECSLGHYVSLVELCCGYLTLSCGEELFPPHANL